MVWTIGGIPFDGTIYNVSGGRFQIERDGYGRTSDWVNPSDIRPVTAASAAAPAPAPAPAQLPLPAPAPAPVPAAPNPTPTPDAFRVGDRVVWTIGGIAFDGTIYNAAGGRFQVERDGYGRTSDWVNATELRHIKAAP